MTKRTISLLGLLAIFLSACVPSVNPFYLEKDLVTDSRLVGEWKPAERSNSTEFWKFQAGADKAYRLTVKEKGGKTGVFTAHLFRLKHQLFLDITPDEIEASPNQVDIVSAALIPGHLLIKLELGERLNLAFCDGEWLDKHLKENPKTLAHRRPGDRLILTASTAELQRFVLKHLTKGELFDDSADLVRSGN